MVIAPRRHPKALLDVFARFSAEEGLVRIVPFFAFTPKFPTFSYLAVGGSTAEEILKFEKLRRFTTWSLPLGCTFPKRAETRPTAQLMLVLSECESSGVFADESETSTFRLAIPATVFCHSLRSSANLRRPSGLPRVDADSKRFPSICFDRLGFRGGRPQ
jgi:hypothetical protein